MTAPAFKEEVKTVPVVVDVTGKCQLVIDRDEEKICGRDGLCEVFIRNPFGLFSVWLCDGHFEKHAQFYRGKRLEREYNAKLPPK